MQEDRQSAVCSLLSGPASGEAARQTSLSQIAQCFLGIQMYSDVLLVDLPKNLDKHLVTALDSLDFIVLVFDATLASIAAARRWKNIFAELSYPADKIIYVENRSGARSQLGGGSVLALEPAAKLPNAYAFLEECCNSAEPAMLKNPRQAFSKAIANFAEQIDRLAKTRSMSGRTEA
jgi:MinD-like ATPase involved in chromosome partitioning or flagellar assembly